MFDQLRRSQFEVIEDSSGENVCVKKLMCIFPSTYLAGRGMLSQIPALEEDFTVERSLLFEILITFWLHLLSES